MKKTAGDNLGSYYHHYPRVAAVLTAASGGKENAMAVAWHMPVSFDPPLFAVSVSAKRFSYNLIAESGQFAINFLPNSEAQLVAAVGGSKGAEVDKFAAFNIEKDEPIKTKAPILSAAYAAYECKVVSDELYGDHHLLIGEIVAVHQNKEAFNDDTIDMPQTNPVLYVGCDRYVAASACEAKTLERGVYPKKS